MPNMMITGKNDQTTHFTEKPRKITNYHVNTVQSSVNSSLKCRSFLAILLDCRF